MVSSSSTVTSWYPPRSLEHLPSERWGRLRRRFRYASGLQWWQQKEELRMVEAHLSGYQDYTDEQLTATLTECRQFFNRDRRLMGVRSEEGRRRAQALALLALYMERTLGIMPFRVQLLAALTMHQGALVQLAPGEGKTLALGLVAVLYGWSGRPCHVVTANDYLAKRDAELLAPFYEACGLKVAAVLPDHSQDQLKSGYAADIVYGTGKQLLADYLRDELLMSGEQLPLQRQLRLLRNPLSNQQVMRGIYALIVDEADSVLIDEANTPLIISGSDYNQRLLEAVPLACSLADLFFSGKHYKIEPVHFDLTFTDAGQILLEEMTADLPPFWRSPSRREELLHQAIFARDLFKRDRNYVVDDDKIVIVDENTGRKMPGRSWSYGLHQAIEAREGVPLTNPSRVMARRSFQAFFRCYHRICGASGTLQGISGELWANYGLPIVKIASRLPNRLQISSPEHFINREEKIESICLRTIALYQQGLPVLIGTRRIGDSEVIAQQLVQYGIDCAILNAKEHHYEAAIIAKAGEVGMVTVATNMAGRGVDIKISEEVAAAGGLQVLMFEPHESHRVEWQLFGRAGRQGANGRATSYISAEDELLIRHLPWLVKWLRYLLAPVWLRGIALQGATRIAQWRSQHFFWRQRRQLTKRDKLLQDQLTFSKY